MESSKPMVGSREDDDQVTSIAAPPQPHINPFTIITWGGLVSRNEVLREIDDTAGEEMVREATDR